MPQILARPPVRHSPTPPLLPPDADHCPESSAWWSSAPASAAPALALISLGPAISIISAAQHQHPYQQQLRSSTSISTSSPLATAGAAISRARARNLEPAPPFQTCSSSRRRDQAWPGRGSFIRRVRASTCRTAAAVAVVKPSAPAPLRRSRALQTDKAGGFGRRTHSPRGASRRNQISDDRQQGEQKQRASTLRARSPSPGPGGGGLPHPPWNPGRASPSSFLFRERALTNAAR